MLTDRLLVFRFNGGDKKAFERIYRRYRDELLALAASLLRDKAAAEDCLHDVFVSFAGKCGSFRLSGSLKGYFSVCTVNRARDMNRSKSQKALSCELANESESCSDEPLQSAMCSERSWQLNGLLAALPYQQREAIVLHLHGGMNFRSIAELDGVAVSTIHSRYRYGIDKLRSLLKVEDVL